MLRRSRIKTLNQWLLPVVALLVVAFIFFPARIVSWIHPSDTGVQAAADETVFTLSIPGLT